MLGILPITGVPHFIDSNGNVPNPEISSTQTDKHDSPNASAKSSLFNPLISQKVTHLYCGYLT